MRNFRRIRCFWLSGLPLALAAGALGAEPSGAEQAREDSPTLATAGRGAPAAASTAVLEPIDLASLAPIIAGVEPIGEAALLGGLVCGRVRTIRSWIPRRVCYPVGTEPANLVAVRGNAAVRRLYPDLRRQQLYRSIYSRF